MERAALVDLLGELEALPDDADGEAIQTQLYAVGKRHAFADLRGGLYVFLGQYRRLAHSSRPAPLPRPRGRILCSAASRPQTGPLHLLTGEVNREDCPTH